ncbi:hypothetical protein ACRQ5B_08800 [Pseudarthrobacter sp. L19]|uniref:hypothetical protein n=1 Tax=Pseudarthrobacter sp. L19 TaxID=3423951 RepID=UPI003D791458
MSMMPTVSTVPHFQPLVRPEWQTAWPWTGASVPMILTDDGAGLATLSQVVAAGRGVTPAARPWMTAMSVPMLPGLSCVPVMAVLPGPPNWLKPKVPSGSRVVGRGVVAPPAVDAAGGSTVVVLLMPSSAQWPAVRISGSPVGS